MQSVTYRKINCQTLLKTASTMKTKVLLPIMFCSVFVNILTAQSKIWDFGNATDWPVNSGYSTDTLFDNLAIIPGSGVTNMGAVETNSATFSAESYTATKRFKLNGGSYDSGATVFTMPTKRYMYFAVNGNCTVKILFKTGGSGTRNVYVTNGTSVVGSLGSSSSTDALVLTASYVGGPTNLYIAGDQASNIYKIEVTGSMGTTTLATLSTKDYSVKNQSLIHVKDRRVYLANIKSGTAVQVYTLTGSQVKTINTASDLDFELPEGLYIVKLKSAEGEKSIKIHVK